MTPRIVAAIFFLPPLAIYDGWTMRRAARGTAIIILLAATLAIGVHLALIAAGLALHLADALPPWWLRTLSFLIATVTALLISIELVCRRASSSFTAWIATVYCVVVIGSPGAWLAQPLESTKAVVFRVPISAMLNSITTDQFDYRTAGKDGILPSRVVLSAPTEIVPDHHTETLAGCRIPVDASWQDDHRQEQTLNFVFNDSSRIVFYADNPIPQSASDVVRGLNAMPTISTALDAEHDLALIRSIYETSYEDIQSARTFKELVHAELRYVLKVTASIPEPPVVAFENAHMAGFLSVFPRREFTQIHAVAYDASGTFRFSITALHSDDIEEAEAMTWMTSILANIDCSP